MCQSAREGGKRCAAHTRPGYEAVMGQVDRTDDTQHVHLFESNKAALVDHASTPTGRAKLVDDMAALEETYRREPASGAHQEAARQAALASLRQVQITADVREQADKEVRRQLRHRDTTTADGSQASPEAAERISGRLHSRLGATPRPTHATPTAGQVGSFVTGADGRTQYKVEMTDGQCSYCGIAETPYTSTTDGNLPLPHPSGGNGKNRCVYGTEIAAVTPTNARTRTRPAPPEHVTAPITDRSRSLADRLG